MGDSALQNPPGPERTYTAPALTRGRSRRRPKPWMSVRRSRGRRRVGLRGGCPFKEAGGTREGRMRPSLVQEAKRTSSACLRGIQPEGPGSCRQEPEHVAPVTGYGAKAPAGFPLWMSMVNSGAAIPGRNDRYGARCDAQRLSQDRHRTTHGASHRAPLPQSGDELKHHGQRALVRMRECAHRLSSRPQRSGEPGPIAKARRQLNGSRIALRASGMTGRG